MMVSRNLFFMKGNQEKFSRRCFEIADEPETKSILTSIIVDEDHHIKILEHMDQLVQSYSK